MSSWMLDMALVAVAFCLMGFVVFRLMFSDQEEGRRDMAARPRPRFERRELGHADRRKYSTPLPAAVERRTGVRR